jgi:hypothetical protein
MIGPSDSGIIGKKGTDLFEKGDMKKGTDLFNSPSSLKIQQPE